MIVIYNSICILDSSKTENGFQQEQEALEYINSYVCEDCKKLIGKQEIRNILETPCCWGIWWVEDDDDM